MLPGALLTTMQFSTALETTFAGYRIARASWPRTKYVAVVAHPSPSPASWGSFAPSGKFLALRDGDRIEPWTPTQGDLFANDWEDRQ